MASFAQLFQHNEVNAQDSICPGICSGNTVPYPDRLISGETCADLDLRAKDETSRTKCDAYQSVTGAACGCENPPTLRCDICDGGYLWNNTAQLGPRREQSCEIIMFAAEIDKSTCDRYEFLIKEFCCAKSCSLCENGQSPQNRDISILGSIEGPISSVIQNPTCSQAAIVAAEWGIVNSRESDGCRFHQNIGSLYCGCASSTQNDACTLCPDGSEPENLNNFFVTKHGINMTCAKAAAYAALQNNGTDKCYDWQVEGIKHCGCPVSDNQCDLCPGMDDHSILTIPGSMTCNKAFVLASQISLNDSQCPNYQADGLNYCGCNIPEDSCTLCPDGSPPSDGFIQDANISCAEATVFATTKSRSTGGCNGVNYLGLKDCGCRIPENSCTLCPDRTFPTKPFMRIPSENSNELGTACGDAYLMFPLDNREPFGSKECSNLQHRTGVLHCGCALDESKCSLCPNGQRVPEFLKNQMSHFPLSTLTCGELEAYGNLQEIHSYDCQTAISTSRSFCCAVDQPIMTISTETNSQINLQTVTIKSNSSTPLLKSTKTPKDSKRQKDHVTKSPKSSKQPKESTKTPKYSKQPKDHVTKSPKSSKKPKASTKTPKHSKQPKGHATKSPKSSKQPKASTKKPKHSKQPEGHSTKSPKSSKQPKASIKTPKHSKQPKDYVTEIPKSSKQPKVNAELLVSIQDYAKIMREGSSNKSGKS